MAKASSVSLRHFTASVHSAVQAAVAKHPKFQLPETSAISLGYLIWGIPVPEPFFTKVTLAETQAFTADIASHIVQASPEALGAARPTASQGAILSVGRHIILGIPVPPEFTELSL